MNKNPEESAMKASGVHRAGLALCGVVLSVWLPAHAADPTPCVASGAQDRPLATESYRIPSEMPGVELYMRNKRPNGVDLFPPERIVLYVHGATYPAETAFDLPLGGFSWMDFLACRGFDVYLVDLRGYGQSTRPPEMERPPADSPPLVTTDVAVRDVAAAVAHIMNRRHVKKISLIGWSWGTTIMAAYTAQNPDKVHRLVLYAPLWVRTPPPADKAEPEQPLGAYRTVTKDAARKRWLNNVPEQKQKTLIPPGWFETWVDTTWATDPTAAKTGLLRAPNGVLQDVRSYWAAGKPYYDPARITAPTLITRGEWDTDTPGHMAQQLFGLLINAPWKRMVEIGEGTHTVIMEKNRGQLFSEVQLFLEEPDPAPPPPPK
jgi:pimeloyl-ACP methyl ester carboxylesterase